MNTLLLDRSVWDLCLDAKQNIAMASDPYSQTQDVASAARTFQGEVFYDTTQGIPYFADILGKAPNAPFLKAQYVKAALTVPGVTSAKCFLSGLTARGLSGQIQFSTNTGAQLNAGF